MSRLGALPLWRHRVILSLLGLFLFAVWFTPAPLLEVDETRYTEATREMIASGNYLIPQYNYHPRYEKPILYYWIQAASVRLLGVSEFAARFPSAIFGLALVLIVHAALLRWLGAWALDDPTARRRARGAALLGAGALATVPLFALWTRMGITDIVLTTFTALAVLALLQVEVTRTLHGDTRPARGWYLLASGAAGLAFLTKGPIGVLVPTLIWFVYHLRQRTLRAACRQMPIVGMLFIFIGIAVPWYIYTIDAVGPAFVKQFFLGENLARFFGGQGYQPDPSSTVSQRLGVYLRGLVEYPPQVLLVLFPYGGFLAYEALRPFAGDAALARHPLLGTMRRFGWTWVWTVVILFAFSWTRGINYLQSITPAVGLLFALYILGRCQATPGGADVAARRARATETVLQVGGVLLLVGAALVMLGQGHAGHRPWDASFPATARVVWMIIMAGTGLTLLGAVLLYARHHSLVMLGAMLGGWLVVLACLVHGVGMLYLHSAFGPSAEVGRYLRHNAPGGVRVIAYCRKFPENFIYYGQRQVDFYTTMWDYHGRPGLLRDLARDAPHLLVISPDGLRSIEEYVEFTEATRFPYFIVGRVTGWKVPPHALPPVPR